MWQNSDIWMAIGSMAVLAVTVFPFFYIAQYIWPCIDDFELSLWTKEAYLETGSVWKVLEAAMSFVKYKYEIWQGSFSSIFLMAMQPGIWGDQYYWTGVILVLGSLMIAVFALTYVCMVKYGKCSKAVWLILCALPTWMWFMRVMFTEEAFYWWTGASYYTGFHAWAMLIVAVAMCVLADWERYGKTRKGVLGVIIAFACFFVGGGNYVSALMLVLVHGSITLIAYVQKKNCKWVLSGWLVFLLTALMISILAPGNTNHMNKSFEHDVTVVEAIFIAIRDGLIDIKDWTNISVVTMYVLLLPFVWKLARGCALKFRFPLLATILSGGLYLAGYAPVSYSFGGYPPGRMINLYYWNYYWLLLFNVFYWIGWLHQKWSTGAAKERALRLVTSQNRWQAAYVCLAGCLFAGAIMYMGIENTNLYYLYKESNMGMYKATDEFFAERVAFFEEHQGEDVIVEELPYRSEITYFGDLYTDVNHVVNTTMAEYYGVKSISITE